jgi:hypothetical protein
MPRKVFTAGEVLAASDVNTFLMDQSVMSFAGTAARGSAIGTATQGMLTYLNDSDTYQSWNGSSWVGLGGGGAATNAIINGAFDIWQRGTSFTTGNAYSADRWVVNSNATFTASRQTFTPGTAPVAGYEGQFFFRFDKASGGTFGVMAQKIEDVRSFAGETITLSFWAKVATGTLTLEPYIAQNFGSGGSSEVGATTSTITVGTSWTRHSVSYAVPSISGKTIGTGSYLEISVGRALTSSAYVLDIWGVQLEAGSTATAFRRNANSLQGELAACQRYYWRNTPGGSYSAHGNGNAYTTTQAQIILNPPVTMRIAPTSVDFGNISLGDGQNTPVAITSIGTPSGTNAIQVIANTASGLTAFRPYAIVNNNNTSGFLALNAEL